MSANLEESPDAHTWTLAEHRVTQICVDMSSVRFQSWTLQASVEVRLSVPFELTQADGTTRTIDPEEPEQVAPLLTLIAREITRLRVTRAGSLRATFSDGSQLTVDSHPRYEAFEVSGAGALEGMGYLASPGGGSPWG